MILWLLACTPPAPDTGAETAADTQDTGPPVEETAREGLYVEVGGGLADVPLGCTASATITIGNAGPGSRTISGALLEGAAELTLREATWPVILGPGQAVELTVDYSPADLGADAATITVTSDDEVNPTIVADVAAETISVGTQTDTFAAVPPRPVDILVTIDQSASMYNDTDAVTELEALPDALQAIPVDWRLTVIGADGCVADPAWVDGAYVDRPYADAIAAMIDPQAAEFGFSQLAIATEQLDAGACDEGLLREGAALALVGITDEVEQSPSNWESYVEQFQGLVSDPTLLAMHAIVGDYPNGCETAQPGIGWYNAAMATGGTFVSICGGVWAEPLAAGIVASARAADAFHLDAWPVPGTIVVTVEGAPATGWTWDEVDNTVVFDPGLEPAIGAAVTVTYEIQGACGG